MTEALKGIVKSFLVFKISLITDSLEQIKYSFLIFQLNSRYFNTLRATWPTGGSRCFMSSELSSHLSEWKNLFLYIHVLQDDELYSKFRTAVLYLMKTIISSPNWIEIMAQKHAALNVLNYFLLDLNIIFSSVSAHSF